METDPEYLNDIFKWMVYGAVAFYRNDQVLLTPKCVNDFKNKCLDNNDDNLEFLKENIEADENSSIKILDLLDRKLNGAKIGPWVVKKFTDYLESSGYDIQMIDRSKHIKGYKLLESSNQLEALKQTGQRIKNL